LLAGDWNGAFSGLAVDFGAKGLWRYDPGSSWRFVHAWNPTQLIGLKTEGFFGASPNSPQTQNWNAWVDLMPGNAGSFYVVGWVYVGNPGVKASLRARYPLAATPDLLQLDLYVQQQHPENAWIQVMTWTEARFEIDAGSTSARYKQVQIFSNGNLIKTMDVQEVS
jgi:hypothetical protein